MGKLRLQGVSWSEVTEQSIVKPWKVNWRGGKERHGLFREGQRMERGTWEHGRFWGWCMKCLSCVCERMTGAGWVGSGRLSSFIHCFNTGLQCAEALSTILLKVMLKTDFLRVSRCARDRFWWVRDGFCKVKQKRLQSMVLRRASEQQSLDSPPWMLASLLIVSLFCRAVIFISSHGHDLRVSIPDLLFTKDTLPSWTKNWCVCSLTPGTEI